MDFFVKQKTSYWMRMSNRSSDVCSSDLLHLSSGIASSRRQPAPPNPHFRIPGAFQQPQAGHPERAARDTPPAPRVPSPKARRACPQAAKCARSCSQSVGGMRSEEHTSELQSLMRTSYAVFCLKKKHKNNIQENT